MSKHQFLAHILNIYGVISVADIEIIGTEIFDRKSVRGSQSLNVGGKNEKGT